MVPPKKKQGDEATAPEETSTPAVENFNMAELLRRLQEDAAEKHELYKKEMAQRDEQHYKEMALTVEQHHKELTQRDEKHHGEIIMYQKEIINRDDRHKQELTEFLSRNDKNLEAIKTDIDKSNKEIEIMRKECQSAQTVVQQRLDELNSKIIGMDDQQEDFFDQTSSQLDDVKQRIDSIEGHQRSTLTRLSQIEGNIGLNYQELLEQIKTNDGRIEYLENKDLQTREHVSQHSKQISEMKNKTDVTEHKIKRCEERITSLELSVQQILQSQSKIDVFDKKLNHCIDQIDDRIVQQVDRVISNFMNPALQNLEKISLSLNSFQQGFQEQIDNINSRINTIPVPIPSSARSPSTECPHQDLGSSVVGPASRPNNTVDSSHLLNLGLQSLSHRLGQTIDNLSTPHQDMSVHHSNISGDNSCNNNHNPPQNNSTPPMNTAPTSSNSQNIFPIHSLLQLNDLPRFSGRREECLPEFLQRLEYKIELFNLDNWNKAHILKLALRGEAQEWLQHIPNRERLDYEAIKQKLLSKYWPESLRISTAELVLSTDYSARQHGQMSAFLTKQIRTLSICNMDSQDALNAMRLARALGGEIHFQYLQSGGNSTAQLLQLVSNYEHAGLGPSSGSTERRQDNRSFDNYNDHRPSHNNNNNNWNRDNRGPNNDRRNDRGNNNVNDRNRNPRNNNGQHWRNNGNNGQQNYQNNRDNNNQYQNNSRYNNNNNNYHNRNANRNNSSQNGMRENQQNDREGSREETNNRPHGTSYNGNQRRGNKNGSSDSSGFKSRVIKAQINNNNNGKRKGVKGKGNQRSPSTSVQDNQPTHSYESDDENGYDVGGTSTSNDSGPPSTSHPNEA